MNFHRKFIITQEFKTRVSLVMLVYSLTNTNSFYNYPRWQSELLSRCDTGATVVVYKYYLLPELHHILVRFMFMMFNATFNNISVISWRLVLLVKKTGVSWEKHPPVASHWRTLSHNVVSSTKTPDKSPLTKSPPIMMKSKC
jgi:hypothetical protein